MTREEAQDKILTLLCTARRRGRTAEASSDDLHDLGIPVGLLSDTVAHMIQNGYLKRANSSVCLDLAGIAWCEQKDAGGSP
jgi:hypothetical protein